MDCKKLGRLTDLETIRPKDTDRQKYKLTNKKKTDRKARQTDRLTDR